MAETKKENAARRVRKGLAALATFARIREGLLATARHKPRGWESRKLLEQSLRLNKDTMEVMRKVVRRDEDDLLRELETSV
jgi:hypothetical protein